MKKVGHTSEFLVGIYWWTWKNKYLLKRRMTPSKIGKTSRGIIILHMCTINQNHMMSGSWNMKHDREFGHILDHFLPLYPTINLKNQNFEKRKKECLEISFSTCVPKVMITWCTVPEIWCRMNRWTDSKKKWHIGRCPN